MLTISQYNTNLYRQGDSNLPIRMQNILKMDPQPDYVEFQTWARLSIPTVLRGKPC